MQNHLSKTCLKNKASLTSVSFLPLFKEEPCRRQETSFPTSKKKRRIFSTIQNYEKKCRWQSVFSTPREKHWEMKMKQNKQNQKNLQGSV